MKKLSILLSIFIIIGIITITSCTPDEVCEQCHSEKVDNTTTQVVERGDTTEYCGTALDELKSEEPVTVGDFTTKWVCQ